MNKPPYTVKAWDERGTLGVIRRGQELVAGWSKDESTGDVHIQHRDGRREWRGQGLSATIDLMHADLEQNNGR